jgi:hypothetical protein
MSNIEKEIKDIIILTLAENGYMSREEISAMISDNIKDHDDITSKERSDLHSDIEKVGKRCDLLWDHVNKIKLPLYIRIKTHISTMWYKFWGF